LEINIIKDLDNPLLDRKEITFNISHTGATPSRDKIKNKLVAQLNSRHELVIVDNIRTEYGTQNTSGYAKIYSDVDRANEIENKHVLKRNKPKPVEEIEELPEEESGESLEESTKEEAVAEDAVSDEPMAEDAVSDEPIAEETAGDEPMAEEAAGDEPIAEEAAGDEPIAEETAGDEPIAEETAGDEPIPEETAGDEPAEEAAGEEPAEEEPAD